MLSRALAEVLAIVAPPACASCRVPLPDAEALVCAGCLRTMPWIRGGRCARCALGAHPGRPCPAAGAAFSLAWAPLAYEGPAGALVAALKFRGALPVAATMAAQMVATAPPGLLQAPGVLVPVPLHPARRRSRGFDQALRLARAVGARSGLPVDDCLRRSGAAARQMGAGRAQRRAEGRLLIEVSRAPPAQAILVDDVHTTGATLEASARALRAAGSQRVVAVTYARTL